MIAPGNGLIQTIFAVAFLVASGYALGRIHQWYRDSARRELAYRQGYDLASDSMFDMAIRKQAGDSIDLAAPDGVGTRWPDATPGISPAPSGAGKASIGGHAVGDSRRRIAVGALQCGANRGGMPSLRVILTSALHYRTR
jgi:hypothetical protein